MNASAINAVRMSRRRFVGILAATAAAGALSPMPPGRALLPVTWRGIALGAEATLTLHHHNQAEAWAAVEACLAEVTRLEAIFSLFQPDSALQRLNTVGYLDGASADLRIVLAEALLCAEQTRGAFDPTIQPLWVVYRNHFANPSANPDGPDDHDIQEALDVVGWRDVAIEGSRIFFRRPGMALTLNGIAQGYISDQVGVLLRARGFEHVLVNMGEPLALGPQYDGYPWNIGIADGDGQGRIIEHIPITSGAVATSGGYGCRFDAAGRFTHILDPRTGKPARQWQSITVVAKRAAQADGLSTALSVVSEDVGRSMLTGGARAFGIPFGDGRGRWL